MLEPEGIEPLGITNSRAPPAVRPPPMKPGSLLLTGDAIPDFGVGNSMTLNPVGLSGIVKRSAICLAFSPLISLAPVIKTSSAPGLPSVPDARVIGVSDTTLATVPGTGLARLFVAKKPSMKVKKDPSQEFFCKSFRELLQQ